MATSNGDSAWSALPNWLWLPSQDTDTDVSWWFKTTGPQLHRLLAEADYPLTGQLEGLLFHYRTVVPHLGPKVSSAQPLWNSFMTNDSTPIEYSWKWGMGGNDRPEVRYSIEAIGCGARTTLDPSNQIPTCQLLQKLEAIIPGFDLTLFHHFRHFFFDRVDVSTAAVADSGIRSSLFVAFEMVRSTISAKVYFIPRERPGATVAEQVSVAIRSAPGVGNGTDALDTMEAFLRDPKGSSLRPFMLAIDCVSPSQSRLKVYVRSPCMSFNFFRSGMTLGGRHTATSMKASEDFHQLWKLALGLDANFPPEMELPRRSSHQTSGSCFHFDVAPRCGAVPDVKAYIAVSHYAASDREIADGLIRFLERRGRSRYGRSYVGAIESLAAAEGHIDTTVGVQTYISCAYQGNQVAVTSYLSPQLYHPLRWS